jgi:predicted aspartyl protease
MLTGHYEKIQDPFSSPSPIALIEVLNPSSSMDGRENVKAILDTGAGITAIPQSIIHGLGGLFYTTINVRLPLGINKITSTKLYSVIIEFGGKSHVVQVLGISKDYAIIGRDILNEYKIFLDAPNEVWSIE